MNSLYSFDSRPSVQTLTYAKKIISALEIQGHVVNISTAPIQDYPSCKKLFVSCQNCSDNILFIPFVNLIFLKQIFRFIISFYYLFFNDKEKSKSVIFIHGVHLPFLLSALISKFLGYKVVLIATDPPGVVLSTDNFMRRFLKKIDKNVINFLLFFIDGAIVPTKKFFKSFKFKKDIPFEIVPGIISKENFSHSSNFINLEKKDIVSVCYSGSIYKNNGIENLVESSKYLPSNVEIHIVGGGEDLDALKIFSSKFDNIVIHGFKSGHDYMNLMCDMDILVNVRPPDQDFTSYSFPSKLFEYLMLRKPIITTRLPSIPQELFDCFNYFDSISPDDISNEICNVIKNFNYKKIDYNFSCAYSNYSIDGISKKILRLKRDIYNV